MNTKSAFQWFLLLALLAGVVFPAAIAQANQPQAAPASASQATPADLILAMNTLRVSYGLPALVEDPIIDAVAQSTAATMAAELLSWHIGNVSGRVQAAGYGGGAKVWATENFSTGFTTIDQIMQVWSDPSHMIPAVNAAYCNIGAGMATASNGTVYYVLQAAYTSAKACGDYHSVVGTTYPGSTAAAPIVPQIIIPVKIATPDADGKIFHVVQPGQSFWAIAVAYKVTIKDLEQWNNLSSNASLQVGEKLFIPSSNTAGYFTPTPPGMVQIATPAEDGKVVHIVQVYQTLSTIATAYKVDVNTILKLNNLQADWPLQIGQKLVIVPSQVTPTATPRPLTPLEKLTPASDGKYYYTVANGDNLSWIAGLFNIKVNDLVAWNNLASGAPIHPGEKLLLEVTPPATVTPTPLPATDTPTPTDVPPTPTVTLTATLAAPSLTPTVTPADPPSGPASSLWIWLAGLVAGGAVLFFAFLKRK